MQPATRSELIRSQPEHQANITEVVDVVSLGGLELLHESKVCPGQEIMVFTELSSVTGRPMCPTGYHQGQRKPTARRIPDTLLHHPRSPTHPYRLLPTPR